MVEKKKASLVEHGKNFKSTDRFSAGRIVSPSGGEIRQSSEKRTGSIWSGGDGSYPTGQLIASHVSHMGNFPGVSKPVRSARIAP